MDLGEVGWGDVDWIGLAKDRNRWRALVNSVLNLRVCRKVSHVYVTQQDAPHRDNFFIMN
jgi:hypothetical protein